MRAVLRATGWLRISLLLFAGGAWCMSFAPTGMPWLQLPGLALALWIIHDRLGAPVSSADGLRTGAVLGWVYGYAMFAVGVCWLYISLHEFGEVPAIVAILAVAALAAYMALFPAFALAMAGAARVALAGFQQGSVSGFSSLAGSGNASGRLALRAAGVHVITGAAWALSEWLRAVVFTGFPWLSTGEAWIDSPVAGFYPVAGTYGVAFLVGLTASLLSAMWCPGLTQESERRRGVNRSASLGFFAVCLLVALAGGWLQGRNWGEQDVDTVTVHLVQPDVSQTIKFDPEHITRNFLDTVLLGRRAAEDSKPGDWLLFPETALPVIWQEAPANWRNAFATLAWEYQTPVIMGAALQDGPEIYTNSVIALLPDSHTAPEQPALRYDKRHLVPFGEFIPPGFRWFVDLMNMPLGDFTRGRGAPGPFSLGSLRVLPNVCYEDVFGHEMAELVRNATEEPNVLFNVSNLAWFGGSWALEQHGQMSRVRAAELRKPMVRATNTGISGVIDARGQWVLRMPDNERAVALAQLVGTRGLTPYARYGLSATVGFVLCVTVLVVLTAFVAAFVAAFLAAFAADRRRDVQ